MALSDSIGVAEESWRWHDPFSAWYEKYSQSLVLKHRCWQSEARISTVIPCPDISRGVYSRFATKHPVFKLQEEGRLYINQGCNNIVE